MIRGCFAGFVIKAAKRSGIVLMALLWLGAPGARAAENWYVATNGPGGDATSWTTAKNNIQDAVSLCSSGDVVWVSNGVYEVGGVTNVPAGSYLTNRVAITTEYVTVRSANNDPTNTIIKGRKYPDVSGPASVRCVYMVKNTSLIGFTLADGGADPVSNPDNGYAGGVKCAAGGSGAMVSNCIIANCYAYHRGGVDGCTLYNCVLRANSAKSSGGAGGNGYMFDCVLLENSSGSHGGAVYNGTFSNCTFIGNEAGDTRAGGVCSGGTFYDCAIVSNSAMKGGVARGGTFHRCTIRGNSVSTSGGVVSSEGGTFYNCLMVSNTAGTVGGVAGGGGALYNCTLVGNSAPYGGGVSTGTLNNCIVYFNESTAGGDNWHGDNNNFTNCCTTPTNDMGGAGNITNAPAFAGEDNYRLAPDSSCINAGFNQDWMTNGVDLDGLRRVRYERVDIGCYEWMHRGSVFTFR